MKPFLLGFTFILGFPAITLATFNDVTLTTSAIIQVGSYTLNVSGSSAVVESISVNASNFSVTLGSGSSITISSPTFNTLTPSSQTGVSSSVCTASASTLTLAYSGAGTITNTITPSVTICTDPAPSPTPTPTTSGGSSSGGGSVSPAYLATLLAPSASTTAYLNSLKVLGCPAGFTCTPNPSYISPTIPITPISESLHLFTQVLRLGAVNSDVRKLQVFL